MLSVRWDPTCTKVSLNEIFLSAPESIISDLAAYLTKEKRAISQKVRAFIDTQLKECDFSSRVDPKELIGKGSHYDLNALYDELNRQYFDSKLTLHITWFGNPATKKGSKITLGLFQDHLRLIKIHRIMDKDRFPKMVVSYVVYHEMVHAFCPSYYDDRGIHRVHSPEFREKERQFPDFERATEWLSDNSKALFIH